MHYIHCMEYRTLFFFCYIFICLVKASTDLKKKKKEKNCIILRCLYKIAKSSYNVKALFQTNFVLLFLCDFALKIFAGSVIRKKKLWFIGVSWYDQRFLILFFLCICYEQQNLAHTSHSGQVLSIKRVIKRFLYILFEIFLKEVSSLDNGCYEFVQKHNEIFESSFL